MRIKCINNDFCKEQLTKDKIYKPQRETLGVYTIIDDRGIINNFFKDRFEIVEEIPKITVDKTLKTIKGISKEDKINHPSHYNNGKMECIEAIEGMLTEEEFRGYLRGNILKYQWRYRNKNGVEDLNKLEWYNNKLKELENKRGDK